MERKHIVVTGVVQGVGFRPFVYKLAKEYGLVGWVLNNVQGVFIEVEGASRAITGFIKDLLEKKPPLAVIDSINVTDSEVLGDDAFNILESQVAGDAFTLVSPDIGICPDCLTELYQESDPRYRYPFTNCTNCGPRLTIIEDIPYDRSKTTMKAFSMCDYCATEYKDPDNRRFHAQPVACPKCGPQVSLLTAEGTLVETTDPLLEAGKLLKQGAILAIKGLGGYHLACDALNEETVKLLRERKQREEKPFAVMVAGLASLNKICAPSTEELELLNSSAKPIVLMPKHEDSPLAQGVAPGNKYVGVMLAYTPLHFLLFDYCPEILVMTSANISDEPIEYQDEGALSNLSNLVDYFVVHNRPIVRRCDDSVTRIFAGAEYPIRRSRGYAPMPVQLKHDVGQILAVGGEQKNTFCVTRGHYGFVSHHIGDLENLATLASFEEAVANYQKLFKIQPRVIAHDLHPEYLSTKWALAQTGVDLVAVQHHEAHIASVIAEHQLEEPVLGFAFDGTGYGWDGKLWGGEVLVGTPKAFTRVLHLDYVPLPGGTRAIKETWRMGYAYARGCAGSDSLGYLQPYRQALPLLEQALDKGINCPLTSSIGRLFDAVSAILELRTKVYYEGQGAIELEQVALESDTPAYFPVELDFKKGIIGTKAMVAALIKAYSAGQARSDLARQFHNSIVRMVVEVAQRLRSELGYNAVVLSGGVFQNLLLLHGITSELEAKNFRVFIHRQLPTNDGGLALGQAIIAAERSVK